MFDLLCMLVSVFFYVHMGVDAFKWSLENASDQLELELETVVSCLAWVLWTELWSFTRALRAPNCWFISLSSSQIFSVAYVCFKVITVSSAPALEKLIQYAHSVCQVQGMLPGGLPSCLVQTRIASPIWTQPVYAKTASGWEVRCLNFHFNSLRSTSAGGCWPVPWKAAEILAQQVQFWGPEVTPVHLLLHVCTVTLIFPVVLTTDSYLSLSTLLTSVSVLLTVEVPAELFKRASAS